ncbi:hypothetical protein SSX86_023233 [Deinandra increscens subsp. villosa]|uniref:(+)-neomenthol dehydrogenase n=1 Tax=Deinandra increscens subsp. villosa TaxID=3103831 RepID=A0AAP0CKG0_9ASTR
MVSSTTTPLQPPISAPATTAKWWSKETVAIVTGANKGIGYALVKQLDISDRGSISSFVAWFRSRFDSFDILVNNAAVSFNPMGENSIDYAEKVINTNYYGSKQFTEAMLPFFRRAASMSRILNISSRLGTLDKLKNTEMKAILEDTEKLSEDRIETVLNVFLQDVAEGRWTTEGWPEIWTDYSVSKLALNAYSQVLARRYKGVVSVNSFCPGFTQTSMTDGKGNHSADDAAEMAAAIALLPRRGLATGKFYTLSTTSSMMSKL